MVCISLLWGQQLGSYRLGETLHSCLVSLRRRCPSPAASVLLEKASPCDSAIVLVVQQGGSSQMERFVLRFDPALQLLRSVSCFFPEAAMPGKRCCEFQGTHNASFNHRVSLDDIQTAFGPAQRVMRGSIKDGKWVTALQYRGASFVFECYQKQPGRTSSSLAEIRVAPPLDSQLSTLSLSVPVALETLHKLHLPQVGFIVVDKPTHAITGLMISNQQVKGDEETFDCIAAEDSKKMDSQPIPGHTTVAVCFGDGCQDVVSKLGAPCSVYYKDDDHWSHLGHHLASLQQTRSGSGQEVCLNYFWLGVDVVLSSNRVCRFVLHSNAPNHFEFSQYSRCFFQLSVSKNGLAVGSSSALLVTPCTHWSVVESHVDAKCTQLLRQCRYFPSVNSSYQPFQTTSLHSLFRQLIFETTSSGNIAKVTVTSLPSLLSLSWPRPSLEVPATSSQRPLTVQETEQEFQMQIKLEVESKQDSFDDEELFHSAESSLTQLSSVQSQPVSGAEVGERLREEEYRTVTIKQKAHFSPNVNLVLTDDPARSDSSSQRKPTSSLCSSLCYTFSSEDQSCSEECRLAASPQDSAVLYSSHSLLLTEESLCLPEEEDGFPSLQLDAFVIVNDEDTLDERGEVEGEESKLRTSSDNPDMDDPNATPDHQSSPARSSSPDLATAPPTADFHYQPQSTITTNAAGAGMTSSRLMALSQDIGLGPSSSSSSSRESSRETKSSPSSRSRFSKPPKSSGGENKANSSTMCLSDSGKERKLIVQRRMVGSGGASAREQAQRRLLSHTKSSEQRVTQKYVSRKTRKMDDRESGEEGDGESNLSPHDDGGVEVSNGGGDTLQLEPSMETAGDDSPVSLMEEAGEPSSPSAGSTQQEAASSTGEAEAVSVNIAAAPHTSKHSTDLFLQREVDSSPIHLPDDSEEAAAPVLSEADGGTASPQEIFPQLDSSSSDSPISRKTWAEEPFSPDTGPASMTRERVIFEQISCEHTELCAILRERREGLTRVRQSLLQCAPDCEGEEGLLAQVENCDEGFLLDLISALNSKRSLWSFRLAAELLPQIKQLLLPSSSERHVLVACQSLQAVVDQHSFTLLKYRAGRLSRVSREELARCGACCRELAAILGQLDDVLLPSLQQRLPPGGGGSELLREVSAARSGVSRILRKMVVE